MNITCYLKFDDRTKVFSEQSKENLFFYTAEIQVCCQKQKHHKFSNDEPLENVNSTSVNDSSSEHHCAVCE